jgi:hypothetical protein
VIGFGPIKGNKCKVCNRIFASGEIYADKGIDSLCNIHAYETDILKMERYMYERYKTEREAK